MRSWVSMVGGRFPQPTGSAAIRTMSGTPPALYLKSARSSSLRCGKQFDPSYRMAPPETLLRRCLAVRSLAAERVLATDMRIDGCDPNRLSKAECGFHRQA